MIKNSVLKTKLGNDIVAPNAKLQNAILAEISQKHQSLTLIAGVAIDLVRFKKQAVITDLMSYFDTDTICYRTGNNSQLLQKQEKLLNPVIAWAKTQNIELLTTNDIMPIKQSEIAKKTALQIINEMNEWQIAVLVTLAKALSSVILAMAVIKKHIDAETAFLLAFLEEEFESEKWGKDSEKEAKIEELRQEVINCGKFVQLI
jgi:chaperone required for assembly of F1-ATPase